RFPCTRRGGCLNFSMVTVHRHHRIAKLLAMQRLVLLHTNSGVLKYREPKPVIDKKTSRFRVRKRWFCHGDGTNLWNRETSLMSKTKLGLLATASALVLSMGAAKADIVIATVGPMTGPYAAFGEQMTQGAQK